MRSALYEWPFTMHLLWEFRCIIGVLLEGIMGLMVAGDFATLIWSIYAGMTIVSLTVHQLRLVTWPIAKLIGLNFRNGRE